MGKFRFLLALLMLCLISSASAQTVDDVLSGHQPGIETPSSNPPAVQKAVPLQPTLPEELLSPKESVSNVSASLLPHDLSPFSMYKQAHPVVKAVMLGLLLASIVTWVILLAKGLELWAAKRKARLTLTDITKAQNLDMLLEKIGDEKGVGAYMVRMAQDEVAASRVALEGAGSEGLKERLSSLLNRIEMHAGRYMARGVAVVATIGSIGPFVGLFGTVWGIMNSFIGIAEAKTTNLAVVAPGIAEALLATAIGLAAAIPAVVIYNILVRWIGGYRQLLADCSAGIERVVSRDLDFQKANRMKTRHINFAAE